MRSFFTNYELEVWPGCARPERAHRSAALTWGYKVDIAAQLSVAFNDLLLLSYLTNYLSEEKKVDGNQ